MHLLPIQGLHAYVVMHVEVNLSAVYLEHTVTCTVCKQVQAEHQRSRLVKLM